jgi:hypothetical protein
MQRMKGIAAARSTSAGFDDRKARVREFKQILRKTGRKNAKLFSKLAKGL